MRADDGGIFPFLVEIRWEMDIGGNIPVHIFVSDFDAFHFLLLEGVVFQLLLSWVLKFFMIMFFSRKNYNKCDPPSKV